MPVTHCAPCAPALGPTAVHDGFATVRATRTCRPQSRLSLLLPLHAEPPVPPPRSCSAISSTGSSMGSSGSLPPPSPAASGAAPAPGLGAPPWLGGYSTWGHHSTASSWSSASGASAHSAHSSRSSSSASSSGSSTWRPGRPLDPLWEEAVAAKPVLRAKPQVPWWEIATRRSRYRSCPTLQVLQVLQVPSTGGPATARVAHGELLDPLPPCRPLLALRHTPPRCAVCLLTFTQVSAGSLAVY